MGSESATVTNGFGTGTASAESAGEQAQVPGLAVPFFYHSSAGPLPHFWENYGIYERAHEEPLGETTNDVEGEFTIDQSRCFNCGDPEHKITECRFRLNRELIALSRQYYQFYQGNLGLGNWQRIHAVEDWRQLRLNWLEEFEPGKIKGDILREALESSQEEWLKNISVWGYPPGWISKTDPRERIRARIWNEVHGDVEDHRDDTEFEIHGNEDYVEKVSFQDAFQVTSYIGKIDTEHSSGDESTISGGSSTTSSDKESNVLSPPIRWAHYPPSYFSSQHLVPYLPAPPSEPWSSTRFENTEAYLNQYNVYHQPPPPSEEPPPLPPLSTPPPLPPSEPVPPLPPLLPPPPPPPPHDPPPLPSKTETHTHLQPLPCQIPTKPPIIAQASMEDTELSECDMDLSDSD